MTRLLRKISGTLPAAISCAKPSTMAVFAHAGFTEQHGIIFCATAENLNDALNFVFATDDRIHVSLAGDFREVAAKRLERRCFNFAFFFLDQRPSFRQMMLPAVWMILRQ